MQSFKPTILRALASHDISRAVGVIHEARGKQELYERQRPELLNKLQQAAIIESTESSNRLEGITVPAEVMDAIMESGAPLNAENRSEAEIAGYRNVLGQLHERAKDIPLNCGTIRQMHRDLMKATDEEGGEWKKTPNDITIKLGDIQSTRAQTTQPYLVDIHMNDLVEAYQKHLQEKKIDPLILIALFALDFLCIHPFSDGNGRMARLLTVWLLYHQNYRMVRYISLERIIEETKDSYYDTLYRSDRGWHDDGKHNPMPWVEYLLAAVLVRVSHGFTNKVETISSAYGMKKALVIDAVDAMLGAFSITEIERKCPSIGRDTIRTTLNDLKKQECIKILKLGRNAKWRKTGKALPQTTTKKDSY